MREGYNENIEQIEKNTEEIENSKAADVSPKEGVADKAKIHKKTQISPVYTVILILLILVILALSVLLLAEKLNLSTSSGTNALDKKWEDITFENTQTDSNGKGKILLKDSVLGEIWVNELSSVDKNRYSPDNFVTNNGFIEYFVDGEKCCETGIDVSEFQGEIDWKKVKAAGIDFAMIRIGFRGYGDAGALIIDEHCRQNLENAIKAGVKVGGYFFSQATSAQEAIAEAKAVIEIVKDYKITYPIAFDWEIIGVDEARTDTVSVENLNKAAVAFCETIKAAGYTPSVYINKRMAYLKYDLELLKDYDIWLTEDGGEASFNYKYDMWQYSYTGAVDGIDGEVDLNISMKKY